MQKILIISGLLLLVVGLLWPLLAKSGLGRLPGDIMVQGDHVRFYFPVLTCLVISIILSAVLWLINR